MTTRPRTWSIGTKLLVIGTLAAVVVAVPTMWHWNDQLVQIVNTPEAIHEIRLNQARMYQLLVRIAAHDGINIYNDIQIDTNTTVVFKTGKRTISND